MRTLIGLILLSLGTFSATFLFFKKDILKKDIESVLIEKVWQTDFDRLIEQRQLPSSWGQIKELRVIALSNKAAKWLRHVKIPVYLNPKGQYQLEISMDHNEDNDSIAVITTYNLVDIKSKNTLWEFGRTYTIPNKKWIDWTENVLRYATYLMPNEEVSASLEEPEHEAEHKDESKPDKNKRDEIKTEIMHDNKQDGKQNDKQDAKVDNKAKLATETQDR